LRSELGLNDPMVVQYLRFLGHAAQGDFGISYQFKRPVIALIAESFPATMELVACSTIVALLFGVVMGVVTAIRRRAWVTRFFLLISLLGVAVPSFLVSITLMYVFSVRLKWLPSNGRGQVVEFAGWTSGLFTVSGLKSLILPTVSLALYQMALIMRIVRSELLEVLKADYIRFARARGIALTTITFKHALKNTLIPVVTIVGLQLGSLIGFSVITEMVFQWPGMGFLFLQSIQSVDIPVMSAYLLIVSILIVLINIIVDLIYAVIDPRLDVAMAR
jgi:peptide/nickel transport system permease protein